MSEDTNINVQVTERLELWRLLKLLYKDRETLSNF